MKTTIPFLSLACLLLLSPILPAQTPPATPTVKILMKDGTSLDVASFRRDGATIMVPLPTGSGEGGYPVAKIARIDFPKPPQIAEAETLLSQGKAAAAIAKIEPILRFHSPLRDIPGNFWPACAFLKMKALVAMQHSKDAEFLLNQIANTPSTDPLITDRVRVEKGASLARRGKDREALEIYDQVIEKSSDPDTLALAWLNKGQSLLAVKDYDPAVLAFLHLPVFYPDMTTLQSPALLGAARAWRGLTDLTTAETYMQSVIDQFPASPEAAAAKIEIKKL